MAPSPNRALLAAAVAAGAGALAAGVSSRRANAASSRRRAAAEAGERVAVTGASGGRIEARVHGPADARTLVLAHCWMGTQELYAKQVADLAGEFRLVVYDHRGHGISDPAPDNDYSLEALAGDLDEVIAATVPAGELPLLGGHSMGAMTIAAWAVSKDCFADHASGVALMSTGLESLAAETSVVGPLPAPFAGAQAQIGALVMEAPGPLSAIPVPIIRRAGGRIALGPGARFEDVELTVRMALDTNALARSRCGRAMARMALLSALDEIDVPGIVIAGGRDLMTPIAHAERIETALPHSLGLRVDPEAGHMTPLESPDVVNAALRELASATATA